MAETTALVPSSYYASIDANAESHLASGHSSGRLWRLEQTVRPDLPEAETCEWYGPNGRWRACRWVGTLVDIYV